MTHRDYPTLIRIAADVSERLGKHPGTAFAEGVVDAIDFVLDPQRTGRTEISQLDQVEKTFIGLKVEHFIRDLLDLPASVRDLRIAGLEVDVKNTVGRSRDWMIPLETYRAREPVLLIASNPDARVSSMGVMVADLKYLGAPNRDRKRRVLSSSNKHILWIVEDSPWPKSRWEGLEMARFQELRVGKESGQVRTAAFFRENPWRATHRSVIVALLHGHYDPLKRIRGGGGARDILKHEGVALLSSTYGGDLLAELGQPIGEDEFIAVIPRTPEEFRLLRAAGKIA
jgi:hypothetical protein